jgi:hypothetical protein
MTPNVVAQYLTILEEHELGLPMVPRRKVRRNA